MSASPWALRSDAEAARKAKRRMRCPDVGQYATQPIRRKRKATSVALSASEIARKRARDHEGVMRRCVNSSALDVFQNNDCPRCGAVMRVDGHLFRCAVDGVCVLRTDSSVALRAFADDAYKSAPNYVKAAHFMSRVKDISPTRATVDGEVSEEALTAICAYLYDVRGWRTSCDVNLYYVCKAVRALKLRPLLRHVAHITAILSGIPYPRITPSQWAMMTTIFKSTLAPFARFKHMLGAKRVNYMHYNYAAFKIAHLLGWDQYLYTYFTVLQGDPNNVKHDKLWKKMCAEPELNCVFYPTMRRDTVVTLLCGQQQRRTRRGR